MSCWDNHYKRSVRGCHRSCHHYAAACGAVKDVPVELARSGVRRRVLSENGVGVHHGARPSAQCIVNALLC